MSIVHLPDGQGGTIPTLRISGVDVQIVNGTGVTGTVNGVGNLIMGYHELLNDGTDYRTGSHNVIVGDRHSYSSYGSLCNGYENSLDGPYSSVISGENNEVMAWCGASTGGYGNTVFPTALHSTIGGGFYNSVVDTESHISGGSMNLVWNGGRASVISGGRNRYTTGTYDWRAGALFQDQ